MKNKIVSTSSTEDDVNKLINRFIDQLNSKKGPVSSKADEEKIEEIIEWMNEHGGATYRKNENGVWILEKLNLLALREVGFQALNTILTKNCIDLPVITKLFVAEMYTRLTSAILLREIVSNHLKT